MADAETEKPKASLKELRDKLLAKLGELKRYRMIIFILFVVLVYGFVVFRINTLSSVEPSQVDISAQSDPIRTAHVDKSVITQLQSLQDNSVSVKALFDQARSNPFQE